MSGKTVCQTPETVNSLKRKIAWPSLLLYRFDVLIIEGVDRGRGIRGVESGAELWVEGVG